MNEYALVHRASGGSRGSVDRGRPAKWPAVVVAGGEAVYPKMLRQELLNKVGDFYIDCERMPAASDLRGHETEVIDKWLDRVQLDREVAA